MKRIVILLLLLILASCAPSVVIIVTPTPVVPTITDVPTEEVTPSDIPTVVTSTVVPTNTYTPPPTNTSIPTVRPSSTPTRVPTNTPVPSTTRMRISYNVNGYAVPDRPYLLQHLRALQPTTVLVMDDLILAGEVAKQLPNTIVIYRGYSSHEGSEWNYKTPQQFVERWQSDRRFLDTHGYQEQRNIIFYTTNEPSFGGNYSVQSFVTHLVETMRLARQAGLTIVAGNYATGMVQPEWITSGLFDPYIKALHTYGHYHGAHEYTTPTLAFGVGQWSLECLLDAACVQPKNWATANQIPTAYWNVAQAQSDIDGFRYFGSVVLNQFNVQSTTQMLPPYWHLRRNDWFLLRADTIGVPRMRIILTECCHDFMADIRIVTDNLKSRFGMTEYMNDLRGVNSHERLWHEFYYPQWTFAEAIYHQLVWADSIYPPEYIGFDLFTWSRNGHWLHADFSGLENPDLYNLHRMLENYARNS